MSVYTAVSEEKLNDFLSNYDIGQLKSFSGISEGIENTNYFVTTSESQFVLTIFEWLNPKEIPYFLDLMAHFSKNSIPCPCPIADKTGDYLRTLCDKPATLITRLDGHTLKDVNAMHTEQTGNLLALMHCTNPSLEHSPYDTRGIEWCEKQSQRLANMMDKNDYALLSSEIEYQRNLNISHLPTGIIHADLFRDNVLFNGDRLSGVIDFYYAYNGLLLYDVAVTVNDWCRNQDASIDSQRYNALINAYNQKRPFTDAEHDSWQDCLRRAALRFWTSRLSDYYFPREGEITHSKNPDAFKNILIHCHNNLLSI